MPKDNEVEEKVIDSVARYDTIVVDSGVHIYADTVESELGDYVRYDDYAALQGEVIRLRAIADAARVYFDGYCQDEASDEVDGNGRGRWTGCPAYQIRDALALKEALNLEPPTDGR